VEITEVRIKLTDDPDDRLRAFCSVTIDDSFVVRDLKIIEGSSGTFVAMPSRKLTAHCQQCGYKNHLRAGYCNQCGARLKTDIPPKDEGGRTKLYADIAHPINTECREMIQQSVITSYEAEIERSQHPDYRSTYEDLYDLEETAETATSPPPSSTPSPAVRIERGQPRPSGPHTKPSVTSEHKPSKQADNDPFGQGIF